MDQAPRKTVIRRLRRDTRLGDGPKVCLLCGYSDPIALIPVDLKWVNSHRHALPRSLFEKDHVTGRNHDPEFVAGICRNCHAEVTELRRIEGITMRYEPDQSTREALRLEALALFSEAAAAALRRWASEKRSKKGSK